MREWLRQAERDAGTGDGGLTTSERDELAQLRRENRRLWEDVEILKRGGCRTNLEPTRAFRGRLVWSWPGRIVVWVTTSRGWIVSS